MRDLRYSWARTINLIGPITFCLIILGIPICFLKGCAPGHPPDLRSFSSGVLVGLKYRLCFVGLFFIAGSLGKFSFEWYRLAHIRRIQTGGGPKNLKEYLLIFPEACPQCGCRDWMVTRWGAEFSSDPYLAQSPGHGEVRRCMRCSYVKGEKEQNEARSHLDYGETTFREKISSPYLTEAESNDIPDL